jgi:aryl-alcohol dehydrogenase-like predicted oxidoreductase
MRYKILGRSGLRVSELALGTMTFGTEWGWGSDLETSRQVFESYANEGGNFIDTANRYTDGTSEKFVAEFIAAEREHFVLATKFSLKEKHGDPNRAGNHRKNLVQSLENSLKRLKTECIDLYWVHAWDFSVHPEELMRALDDQVRAGKILHVGVSDTPAWVVSQANTLAELRGWTPFTALQVEYSLIERTPERDLLPMARAFNLAVTPWAALAGGLLTGKYTTQNTDNQARRLKEGQGRLADKNVQIAKVVDQIAQEIGKPASQVALNWVRQQSGTIIPIVGSRRPEQIVQNIEATTWKLEQAQLERLDAASKIDLGFPHAFLDSPGVRDVLFAGTRDQIDL